VIYLNQTKNQLSGGTIHRHPEQATDTGGNAAYSSFLIKLNIHFGECIFWSTKYLPVYA